MKSLLVHGSSFAFFFLLLGWEHAVGVPFFVMGYVVLLTARFAKQLQLPGFLFWSACIAWCFALSWSFVFLLLFLIFVNYEYQEKIVFERSMRFFFSLLGSFLLLSIVQHISWNTSLVVYYGGAIVLLLFLSRLFVRRSTL